MLKLLKMKKRLILSMTIIVCCLNFLFCQNFNERDSLKRIIKILNNAVYEYRYSARKEYNLYYHWKIKNDTAFGEIGSFFYDGVKASFPSHCVSFIKLHFENGKLIKISFAQTESQSEILVLSKDIIKIQGLDENGKCCWVSENYRATIKTPKRVKRYLKV